jgi:hypothetical protein
LEKDIIGTYPIDSPLKTKKSFSESEKKELARKHEQCILEEDKKAKEKYFANKKEDMADGLAFLIVGFPILFFYQRRKKQ